MGRNIHSNYYEDMYVKYGCQTCKRCFIVGEKLSDNMRLTCPYCQSLEVEMLASSTEESADEMDMGCLGIYYNLYSDGSLMLYTEREFAAALTLYADKEIPLRCVTDCVKQYCIDRDGRVSE